MIPESIQLPEACREVDFAFYRPGADSARVLSRPEPTDADLLARRKARGKRPLTLPALRHEVIRPTWPRLQGSTLYLTVETSDNTALVNVDFCAFMNVWIYAKEVDVRRAERLRKRILALITPPARLYLSLPYGLYFDDFCTNQHGFAPIERRPGVPAVS
jgi:hypothetical protein